ncbi:MAG: right-handed parallel beta-helix repeat-containing protein [Planctomycetota bacterium]
MLFPLLSLALTAFPAPQKDLPVVKVTQDNTEITESCLVVIPMGKVIPDVDGNGVIHILTDGVEVTFEQGSILNGAPLGVDGNALEGIGLRVLGAKNVVVRNLVTRGYRCGMLATKADGLRVEGADFKRNFRQKLQSTLQEESVADWLRPHENDAQEWRKNYGAGLCIEQSDGVKVSQVLVREQQNGIILDRVTHAELRDNDCSFLSGWGLAMWRSSDNLIEQNRFDFCVRGYSHGVYNRGQDSAGILMFEQCSRNRIIANSASHCGDGIFSFSGKQALGEIPPPDADFDYAGRGNNDNQFLGNVLHDSAAHGLELTFGFRNLIQGNSFSGNAICGIWAGYSQETTIHLNTFRNNGDQGVGLERGGINIDHSRNNKIQANEFWENACGVHLWSLESPFANTPWGQANDLSATGNLILDNSFQGEGLAIQLRGDVVAEHAENRFLGPYLDQVKAEDAVSLEDGAQWKISGEKISPIKITQFVEAPEVQYMGREHIVMTEWGPWDQKSSLWQLISKSGAEHIYRMLPEDAEVALRFVDGGRTVSIRPVKGESSFGKLYRVFGGRNMQYYLLTARVNRKSFVSEGSFLATTWEVRNFVSPVDPREDVDTWRAAGESDDASVWKTSNLFLDYQFEGPDKVAGNSAMKPLDVVDHFGTIATGRIVMPAGNWTFRVRSDDGVRVWADDVLLIDNWTMHGPTWNEGVLELEKRKAVNLRVEHFELDGLSLLQLEVLRKR